MTVLLVRHGKAGSRQKWKGPGPDEARPLSKKGWRQAEGLVEVLRDFEITRLLSSPFLRCVQTLEPLGAALGLHVELTEELAEGATPAVTRDLLRRLGGTTAALSTHGDVIPNLLDHLIEEEGLDLPPDYPCAKGSTWVLTDVDSRLAAHYIPPPPD